MINEDRIVFGMGTILVGTYALTLELMHIDPSAVIGEPISKDFSDSMKVLKKATFKKMLSLADKLSQVSEGNSTFEHEGYIFDFTNYNEKSSEAVLKGVRFIVAQKQIELAC
ncbi:hypothetical protein J2W97_001203 [Paenibacillus jamilae]|nr:hypothetical protein [Paenibacillus jamilae]